MKLKFPGGITLTSFITSTPYVIVPATSIVEYSSRASRLKALLDEIHVHECVVDELKRKHEKSLAAIRPSDKRYHEKELKDAKVRSRSLLILRIETEEKLAIELSKGHPKQHPATGEESVVDETHETLVDQQTFFDLFFSDLEQAKRSVEIVCPFVSDYRYDVLQKLGSLRVKGLRCTIYTRPPEKDNGKAYLDEALRLNIEVVQKKMWHHKLAIIDNRICWEGSLNILSHGGSKDTMRKLVGRKYAEQYRKLLGLEPLN
jgi:hypothetical protein